MHFLLSFVFVFSESRLWLPAQIQGLPVQRDPSHCGLWRHHVHVAGCRPTMSALCGPHPSSNVRAPRASWTAMWQPALPLPPRAPGDLHRDAGDPEARFWPCPARQLGHHRQHHNAKAWFFFFFGRDSHTFPTLLLSFTSLKTSPVLFRCCCRTWDALPSTSLRVQSASWFAHTRLCSAPTGCRAPPSPRAQGPVQWRDYSCPAAWDSCEIWAASKQTNICVDLKLHKLHPRLRFPWREVKCQGPLKCFTFIYIYFV